MKATGWFTLGKAVALLETISMTTASREWAIHDHFKYKDMMNKRQQMQQAVEETIWLQSERERERANAYTSKVRHIVLTLRKWQHHFKWLCQKDKYSQHESWRNTNFGQRNRTPETFFLRPLSNIGIEVKLSLKNNEKEKGGGGGQCDKNTASERSKKPWRTRPNRFRYRLVWQDSTRVKSEKKSNKKKKKAEHLFWNARFTTELYVK